MALIVRFCFTRPIPKGLLCFFLNIKYDCKIHVNHCEFTNPKRRDKIHVNHCEFTNPVFCKRSFLLVVAKKKRPATNRHCEFKARFKFKSAFQISKQPAIRRRRKTAIARTPERSGG